jgi:hypothetical protein
MTIENIQILIDKYLAGQSSPEEDKLVEEFYASFEKKQGLTEQLDRDDIEASVKHGFQSIKKALKL